jgi:hypothetical protein
MATMNVLDSAGSTVAIEKPLTPGRAAAASSRPIVLSTEDKTALDAITREFSVAGSTVTRPANTTAYTAADAVSNSATAGSVTAISFTLSDLNDDPIALSRCRIDSTDTGLGGNMLRIYLYQSDPTASTGVVGGDNAAFSTKQGTFIGSMSGTLKTFSDGSGGVLGPGRGHDAL